MVSLPFFVIYLALLVPGFTPDPSSAFLPLLCALERWSPRTSDPGLPYFVAFKGNDWIAPQKWEMRQK